MNRHVGQDVTKLFSRAAGEGLVITKIDADDAIRKFGKEMDRVTNKVREESIPIIIGTAVLTTGLLWLVLWSVKQT